MEARRSSRRLIALWSIIVLAALTLIAYAFVPIIVGVIGIGDRWGPKIYPVSYHESLYLLGWEIGSHEETKPRMHAGAKREMRPWFYGCGPSASEVVISGSGQGSGATNAQP